MFGHLIYSSRHGIFPFEEMIFCCLCYSKLCSCATNTGYRSAWNAPSDRGLHFQSVVVVSRPEPSWEDGIFVSHALLVRRRFDLCKKLSIIIRMTRIDGASRQQRISIICVSCNDRHAT